MSFYTDEQLSMILSAAGLIYWDQLKIDLEEGTTKFMISINGKVLRNNWKMLDDAYYELNDWICNVCGFVGFYSGRDYTSHILNKVLKLELA